MRRRDFMLGAAAVAGLTTMTGRGTRAQTSDAAKRARIALMGYSLHRMVRTNQPSDPARTLDIMQFGEFCADTFGIHQFSLQSSYLASTEPSWLREFQARLDKTKSRVVQVNLEFGTGYNMAVEAPVGRMQMIDLHRAWLDKAPILNCTRYMVNQGPLTEANTQIVTSNFRAIVELAKPKGINISCETRPPAAARGTTTPAAGAPAATAPPPPTATDGRPSYMTLLEVLKASGASACVDFMNFPSQEVQLQGIRDMLPISSGLVHAATRFDLAPAMAVCRTAGYKGLFAIKAEQQGDAVENSRKILEGLLANL